MIEPFSSTSHFRDEFNKGLIKLAEHGGLGTFILACANASFEHLFDEFKPLLREQYEDLYQQYRNAFLQGVDLDVVDEDLLVFLKMHAIGFDNIAASKLRNEAIWKLQFNHLRSFRPRRITQFIHQGTSQPFDEDDFNFNKPFMARECFWQGQLLGREVDLFYNKYPFADLHGLLVPDRQQKIAQLLAEHDHDYIFQLSDALQHSLPGVGFGYNSYGAYASVNHLHFQMFVGTEGLPVTDPCWQHNGGEREYPAQCLVFNDARSSWQYIEQLHAQQQPYNLLYLPGRIYVYPRKAQGMVEVPPWSSGFTWYELSGVMICFNFEDFEQISAESIEKRLSELRVEA